IDLLAFLCRRIRARNFELPVLHEVIIGVAAARFAPACKPRAAIGHQGIALVVGRGLGFDLLDAVFKILHRLRRRPGKSQPRGDQREQSQPGWYHKNPVAAAARQTIHPQDFPTDSLITCRKYGFLRAKVPIDVATLPQPLALFRVANSCHDWAQLVEQNLIVATQGFLVMRSVRAIATLASVAAIACSIFAFSWVGLALLGF